MSGPMTGIKIVDLCSMMSGPWATDILGDQGADVIKVEVPGKGDHVRSLPNRSGDMSAMFVNVNRSKRSLTLNLKTPEGVAVLKKLVATADVVVQNFRPGVVERLGIGYDDLAPLNSKLIYLSMSGFGERGPASGQRVYDSLIQALTGLTTVQAGSDEERPRLIRTILPDKLTAVVAAQALSAALFARERTGEGQHIRLSMLEAVLSFLWASDMGAYTFPDQPVPLAKGGSFIDLIYQTADGYITVATNSNGEWQSMCKALGHPEWIEDERFSTPVGRSAHINERLELIQAVLLDKNSAEWLALLDEFDVPAAPILKRSEVIEHPQVKASEIIVELEHPTAGRLRQARVAARFLGTVPDAPKGAPLLGQHNTEILAEIGYSNDEIASLAAEKVIGTEQDANAGVLA
ncbi:MULTISPECIES: CaiB/BaiF CoA transferase family protein [unclassified Rhodococcus (in: high G+C Gram-positive bacteria)]|uniref:CaiB/BaiF CoA transferase family protein n=1 Tax=unclassified Rhodococcus (in: high G+C Gram-positive bacteria) TaxID=192944 RepID=UPI00215D2897|nr:MULTISPECIES: CaiB/BaiF CoA-transferase family protein [unclassified Rhodococcus (in: high G+C Gram-positive bacteria)]